MSDDIDDLIDQLKEKDQKFVSPTATNVKVEENEVGEFIIKNAAEIVQNGVDLINELRVAVGQSADADEIAALSELMRATNSTLDTLNKINIQNKKSVLAKELKEMDGGAKQLTSAGDTNILVATREEIRGLLKPLEEIEEEAGKVIDIEAKENEK